MEVLDSQNWRGYRIELVPDDDAGNPFAEFDGPTLVLHAKAERNFGWSTDKDWVSRLQSALDDLAQRSSHRLTLYGPGGALEIVSRWLRVAHGIPVVLHVSAYVHSGTMVYLGSGDHPMDPGGWDSGWIGWLFATPEQLTEWGLTDPDKIEESLRASFAEFAAWVGQDVVGYRVIDSEGEEVHSCYGFYGSDGFTGPDGWILQEAHSFIDAEITSKGGLHAVTG